MIELNILRERLRQFQERAVFLRVFAVYLGVLAIMIFGMGIFVFVKWTELRRVNREIARLEADIRAEQAVVDNLKRYQGETRDLLKELAFWRKELGERVVWVRKLAFIGESAPMGLWLRKVSRVRVVKQVENRKDDFFVVEASVDPGLKNERRAVAEFKANLEARSVGEFSTIRLQEVRRSVSNQREIVMVKIACAIYGGSGDEKLAQLR